jgi:hypothetical protein
MFENISKGEFKLKQKYYADTDFEFQISIPPYWIATVRGDTEEISRQNAEFVFYCFSLQQRYDISKLERCVELLHDMNDLYINKKTIELPILFSEIEQLLKQIKK